MRGFGFPPCVVFDNQLPGKFRKKKALPAG
jgi:hypothetical protein